jgi:IS605 OrfB family transposase
LTFWRKYDILYLTQKNQLRGLTKSEYSALRSLCALSKNLYNSTLYAVRQYYFAKKKYLRYESAYHICKENENYKLLGTDTAQQTMKVVDRNFKSFFALISKAKSGSYQFNQIRLPHYLPKDGLFSLIIPRIKVKDGYFDVPMSPLFKREHGKIKIKFPTNLNYANLKEIRIHPKLNGRYFDIEYVHEAETEPQNFNQNHALAVDLGLDNLTTCVTNTGASFIVDGQKLKSYNQWWNKENARLQSIKDLQGIKSVTRKQYFLARKRNNRVNYYLNKTARIIMNYCLENTIGNIVVDYNPDWKRNINIGGKNNQNFVNIPHGNLRQKLQSLCERYGINYIEQEESYTSKADFFANDDLPTWNADNPKDYGFSGKRISRGQYKSTNGIVINADINGSLNILRKSKLIDLTVLQDSGCLDQPKRIRIS